MITVNEEAKNKSSLLLPPMASQEKSNLIDSRQTQQRRLIKSTLEPEFLTAGSYQVTHEDTTK